MRIHTISRKWLTIALCFVVCGSAAPLVGGYSPIHRGSVNESRETLHPQLMTAGLRGVDVTISGAIGQNGWYVSTVVITILPDEVNATYYSFDNQTWDVYTGPVTVDSDGYYTFFVLYDGHLYGPYPFKIDKTPPTLLDLSAEKIEKHTWRISANVSDATSGVARVEFYCNSFLIFNDTSAPYGWIYEGPAFHLQAIVFDNAGNGMTGPFWPGRIAFSVIGFIENPQFSETGVNFFARFALYSQPPFSFEILINEPFYVYPGYTGHVGDSFIWIKFSGYC